MKHTLLLVLLLIGFSASAQWTSTITNSKTQEQTTIAQTRDVFGNKTVISTQNPYEETTIRQRQTVFGNSWEVSDYKGQVKGVLQESNMPPKVLGGSQYIWTPR